ncbi:hypothetical protein IAU59_007400 [Kwoniella sp. CBS 9459]
MAQGNTSASVPDMSCVLIERDISANRHKLKVTELKELLAKHHLVQTGKKDDLIKRLLDNNVTLEEGHEGADDEELVDVDADTNDALTEPTSAPAVPQASQTVAVPAVPAPSEQTPSTTATNGNGVHTATTVTTTNEEGTNAGAAQEPQELTEEQKAMKARAERFGIPFNPNPTPKTKQNSKAKNAATTADATPAATTSAAGTAAASQQQDKKEKVGAGAIDANPLGLSQEVLDKRAAKFGLPEKKVEAPAPSAKPTTTAVSTVKPVSKAAETKKKEEISPELAEKIAIEEEKKRKRAEKFGTAVKPASSTAPSTANGSSEPDAKKVKV